MNLIPYIDAYTKGKKTAKQVALLVKDDPQGAVELRDALKARWETDSYHDYQDTLGDNVALLTQAIDVYHAIDLGKPPLEGLGFLYKEFLKGN